MENIKDKFQIEVDRETFWDVAFGELTTYRISKANNCPYIGDICTFLSSGLISKRKVKKIEAREDGDCIIHFGPTD